MRFSSGLPLLVVGLCSVALCRDSILVTNGDVNIRFSVPTPITLIAERGIISSIGVSTPCQVVSGLATPVPSGSVCGVNATSVAKAGAGILVEYTSGSPYVASLGACSAQCLATSCCTNIYFIVGSNCDLHYRPKAYAPNAGPSYHYYDVSCFNCGGLTCTASTSLSTTTFASISSSSVQSTLSSATSTLSSTPTACGAVALTSPTPSGSICGVQADSVVVSGSGILTEYGSGSPYVASIDAKGKGACVQEPWIWLSWQVAAAVDDIRGADKVTFGPPKAVIPRPPRTDAGMVDTIVELAVTLCNLAQPHFMCIESS